KDIWQQLYEFPLIETSETVNLAGLQRNPQFKALSKILRIQNISLFNKKPVIHKLSHQHLNTHFWIVETAETTENAIPVSAVRNYAVPVLIANFVSEFFGE